MSINTLILTGEGINCEVETARAFEMAGSETSLMHLADFLELESLDAYDILVFPGGFSYGDEIRSGKILAEKIKQKQLDNILDFIQKKKPVLGICNGFQILTQLGVFNEPAPITLSHNDHDKFINFWVNLDIKDTNSLWFKNLKSPLLMPVRHKEGRISGELPDKSLVLSYQQDINGSVNCCAGVTNSAGNVLGLMPHPEAAIHDFLLPHTPEKAVQNLNLFKNAITYATRMKQ